MRYYAAKRENQDAYNFALTGEELVRTYVIKRELYWGKKVGSPSTPLIDGEFLYPPAATPDSVFTDYGFVEDQCNPADQILGSLYVVIRRRFIIPVMVDVTFDDRFQKYIKITKEVIEPTATAPAAPSNGTVVEIQDGNRFHSVRITRELLLGEGVTYPYSLPSIPGSYNRQFPAKLESVSFVMAWAWADSTTAAQSYSEDYYFKFKKTEARPGPYSTVVTRYITNDPTAVQTAHPMTLIPQPVTESIALVGWWFNASTKGNSTFAIAKEYPVPDTIHEELSVAISGTGGPGSRTWTETLDATPGATAFFALSTAVVDFDVQQLPLGLFMVSVVTANIASLYS